MRMIPLDPALRRREDTQAQLGSSICSSTRRGFLNTQRFGRVNAEAMSVYRRALSYFAADGVRIATLVALIGISVCVGLLEAWPLAVLIDSVLTGQPKSDWVHGLFLSILPASKVGQVIGLVLMGMALHIIGYLAWFGRMMINYHLNYRRHHAGSLRSVHQAPAARPHLPPQPATG